MAMSSIAAAVYLIGSETFAEKTWYLSFEHPSEMGLPV
jgi:hypothetical protein